MDLCGITVVELRAGRPVLRAHNLTAHLARARTGADEARRRGRCRGEPRSQPDAAALLAPARAAAGSAAAASLLAAEREPQQADPEPALRRPQAGDPLVAEDLRGHRRTRPWPGATISSSGRDVGRTSPSDAGVLVDGLGRSRPEPEARRDPGDRAVGAVGAWSHRAGRAARPRTRGAPTITQQERRRPRRAARAAGSAGVTDPPAAGSRSAGLDDPARCRRGRPERTTRGAALGDRRAGRQRARPATGRRRSDRT